MAMIRLLVQPAKQKQLKLIVSVFWCMDGLPRFDGPVKTGKARCEQNRKSSMRAYVFRFAPDCVAKLPLMRIANHDSVGGEGIGGSGA